MPSPAEIAYREGVRALEGQAQDLASIRGHVSLSLSAGGLAAAFLGGLNTDHGPAFLVAVVAFGLLAALTIRVYWPLEFAWDFDGYQLVTDYVDLVPPPSDDDVMRDLAVHAAEDYKTNRARLSLLYTLQSAALLIFGLEVLALLVDLATE